MSAEDSRTVVRLGAAQAMRDGFLGWQCRIRQHAVRKAGGRPDQGMRPQLVTDAEPSQPAGAITVLIVHRDSEPMTAELRHICRRTHDPAKRYQDGLRLLQSTFYQYPREFTDELTALFAPGSAVVERTLAAGRCVLTFEQYRQRFVLPCTVRALSEDHPLFQATYWHNCLFNPNLPGAVTVLAFKPDWQRAEADPPVA